MWIFQTLTILKSCPGSCEVQQKMSARLVQPLWCLLLQTNKQKYIYTGWVKKSVICGTLCKIAPFFVTPMTQKKIREAFFLSTSKVQKSKNVYINYVYRNLKKFKHWIKESQKIRKIVMRKFAIFSSGLIFKEKLFEFSSLSSQYILKY